MDSVGTGTLEKSKRRDQEIRLTLRVVQVKVTGCPGDVLGPVGAVEDVTDVPAEFVGEVDSGVVLEGVLDTHVAVLAAIDLRHIVETVEPPPLSTYLST